MTAKNFMAAMAAFGAAQLCAPVAMAANSVSFIEQAADDVAARDKSLLEAIQHRESATLAILDKIVDAEIPPEYVAESDPARAGPLPYHLQESITGVEKMQKKIDVVFKRHVGQFRTFCAQAATVASPLCSEFEYWDWRHNRHDTSP